MAMNVGSVALLQTETVIRALPSWNDAENGKFCIDGRRVKADEVVQSRYAYRRKPRCARQSQVCLK